MLEGVGESVVMSQRNILRDDEFNHLLMPLTSTFRRRKLLVNGCLSGIQSYKEYLQDEH